MREDIPDVVKVYEKHKHELKNSHKITKRQRRRETKDQRIKFNNSIIERSFVQEDTPIDLMKSDNMKEIKLKAHEPSTGADEIVKNMVRTYFNL